MALAASVWLTPHDTSPMRSWSSSSTRTGDGLLALSSRPSPSRPPSPQPHTHSEPSSAIAAVCADPHETLRTRCGGALGSAPSRGSRSATGVGSEQ